MDTSLTIKNTSELTLEQLYKLKEEAQYSIIHIEDQKNSKKDTYYDRYSIDEFIQIKGKIQEYVSNIPRIDENDPDREKKIFTYVYEKIANNVVYDEVAADACDLTGYDRDMADNRIKAASNLYGGLIDGKSICAGYTEILRNVLAEVGIDSIYMSGKGEKGSHAWNQVYLDGKWYNCDLTNDADFILEGLKLPHFLKSNEDFTRLEKYPEHDKNKMHDARESISDEMQEKFIEEQRENIIKEKEKEKQTSKSENKGFLPGLKKFFGQTKINIQEMLKVFTNKKDIEMEDR